MTSTVHALRETQPNETLVERLIAAGIISQQQLHQALQEKAKRKRPLGQILVELGMISEKVLSETLQQLLVDTRLDLRVLLPDPRAIAMMPREIAERGCVLPIGLDDDAKLLTLAVPESFDLSGDNALFRSLGSDLDIATTIAAESDIKAAIRKFYGVNLAIPDILREVDGADVGQIDAVSDVTSYVHPLIRLVDAIIVEASRRRASAIHFEPEQGFLRVRFRIDGVLSQVMALHHSYWPCMQDRLIQMSGMDADFECRSAEGWASISLAQRRVALYFSRRATLKGEDVVVRIADRLQAATPLEELGLQSESLSRLRLLMARPHGLVIVAGPPASGKTSTLHAMLGYRSDESVAIVTHEEPIAGPLPLLRQTTLSNGDAATDGSGLESLLQQDADVLAMDELRDKSTAALALRAASSGRQVFVALRARSAIAALAQLRDYGLAPRQLAGNVSGVVSQCLLRKLCPYCKQAYTPQLFEQAILGISDSPALEVYREVGCEQCDYLGFKDRLAVFEVLAMDNELDELLENDTTPIVVQRVAEAAGFIGIVKEAIREVLAGTTSLAEASRVVDLSARLK